MRLLIDSTSFQRQQTGIEYYGFEISKHLYRQLIGSNHQIYFLFHQQYPKWFIEKKNIKGVIYKGYSKLLMEQFWIPKIALKYKIKSIYFPVFPPSLLFILIKLFLNIKIYRTIFDTIMWKSTKTISLKNRLYMKPLESIGIFYYTKVFTISDFSKKEIINTFPKLNKKVINAGIGIKKIQNRNNVTLSLLQEIYPIKYKYFLLFVGTIEPRKNLIFLLEILHILVLKKSHLKLVIVGREGWGYKELKKHKYYSKLSNYIIETSFISDEKLSVLYQNALSLIFPSKYEGYGLPIIEAMSMGCPTISANNSAIPEAVSNAGILIDGWNPYQWADIILELQINKKLQQDIIDKGYNRVQKIDWKQTTEILYKELLKY